MMKMRKNTKNSTWKSKRKRNNIRRETKIGKALLGREWD
jgi:hypothetical protein